MDGKIYNLEELIAIDDELLQSEELHLSPEERQEIQKHRDKMEKKLKEQNINNSKIWRGKNGNGKQRKS